MLELIQITQGIIERGLIFGLIVAAVYLSSRLINFDNLAVDGAFGLGGAVTALLISWQLNPWLALACALVAGSLSGALTGLLNTKLKLNNLISGIIVSTGLFSITLKLTGANLSLGGKTTLFTALPSFLAPYQNLLLLAGICTLVFATIKWFLTTEIGYLLQTAGSSPQMLTNVGKSIDFYITMGLVLSNSLAALSGALFVQYTGYFSIWTSVGILIIGLAGMIIAQTFSKNFGAALLIGAIAYQAIIALTFELQIDQDWNKLITAVLIILLIVLKDWLNQNNLKPNGKYSC